MTEENEINEMNEEEIAEAVSDETAADAEADPVDALQAELEAAQALAAENMDGWQRAAAEFANYKKRQERERQQMHENSVARVVRRYLEVADDLDRALQNRPADGEAAEWANGIELVYRKLLSLLESEGVIVMEVEGQQFDPNLHEAIAQEDSEEHDSGTIIEVLQKGYLIGDRVLRPALVRVAS